MKRTTQELFNMASDDKERWEVLVNASKDSYTVYLDNGDNFVKFSGDEENVGYLDRCIGNSGGVVYLLDLLGSNYEHV